MPLPSWNDTETKQGILNFVAAASDENGPDYMLPGDRIAAFGYDGTLWVEQPAPAQTGLLFGKLVEQVKANPSLAAEEPYKAIVNKDPAFLQALAQQIPEAIIAFLKGVGGAWEGTTPEEYEAEAKAFLAANIHPATKALDRPRLPADVGVVRFAAGQWLADFRLLGQRPRSSWRPLRGWLDHGQHEG